MEPYPEEPAAHDREFAVERALSYPRGFVGLRALWTILKIGWQYLNGLAETWPAAAHSSP